MLFPDSHPPLRQTPATKANAKVAKGKQAAAPKKAAAAPKKVSGKKRTVEDVYKKVSQHEHILLRPDTYVGSVERTSQTLWVGELLCARVAYLCAQCSVLFLCVFCSALCACVVHQASAHFAPLCRTNFSHSLLFCTSLWTSQVWDDAEQCMRNREIKYTPGLYKIFDEILVNAADNRQRDPSMSFIK
jgi:hypothetical protein